MPIEAALLRGQSPLGIKECPVCGVDNPEDEFMRGLVHRRRRKFFFFGEKWPYCAVICKKCKEIIAYEKPWKLIEE